MRINNLRIFLISVVAVGTFFILPAKTFAVSSSSQSLICGSTSQNISTIEDITNKYIPTGRAYLKLNYQSSPIKLSLYINNYSNSQCNFIGVANVSPNSWVYIGQISQSSNDIIIQGSDIQVAPYQAAAQLMVVPNNQCTPVTNCTVSYAGLSGILQLDDSNILSGATDQIAVYGLKTLGGVGVKSVSYYADNQGDLLYSSSSLRPINRNYLSGGIHNIQLQIKLNNGQTIYVNQTIDMGIDWTGTLYLKSLIYRNSGSAAIFIIVGITLLLFVILLALARFVYKRRRTNKFHGLSNYHQPAPGRAKDDRIIIK